MDDRLDLHRRLDRDVAAVAVDWQVVLPQITTKLQFFGGAADAGTYLTKPGGARTRCCSARSWSSITTIVNMLGVKLMARINNVGVTAELIGSTRAVILLLFHFARGPGGHRPHATATAPATAGATSARC